MSCEIQKRGLLQTTDQAGERPLRIHLVTPFWGGRDYFGGIPTAVQGYYSLLNSLDAEVRVSAGIRISPSYRDASRWRKLTACAARKVGCCDGSELIRCVRNVYWADVVMVHAWFHLLARLAASYATKINKPWILVPHGVLMTEARRYHALRKRIELFAGGDRLIQKARAAFVTTEFEGVHSRPHLPSCQIIVPVPSEIEPNYRAREKAKQTRLRLGYLGRFHAVKRIDMMLEACRRSTGTSEEFDLILVGSDEGNMAPRLTALFSDLFLSGRVSWNGPLTGRDKSVFLSEIDGLFLISEFENNGLAILEALAQGTPSIVGRSVGIARTIEEYRVGVLVADPSVDALLEGVRELRERFVIPDVDRSPMRALAIELGVKVPVERVLQGLNLCGYSFDSAQTDLAWASSNSRSPVTAGNHPPGSAA